MLLAETTAAMAINDDNIYLDFDILNGPEDMH